MSRPWNMEGLVAARVLAAAGAPLAHTGLALDRLGSEVDLALWALVGRTPEQALERLNSGVKVRPAPHPLRRRVLAVLGLGPATVPTLAEILDEDPAEVDAALSEAAWADLVDADDPPLPCGRDAMIWRLRRKEFAEAANSPAREEAQA